MVMVIVGTEDTITKQMPIGISGHNQIHFQDTGTITGVNTYSMYLMQKVSTFKLLNLR